MYTLSNIKRYESKPTAPKPWKKIIATIQDGTTVTIWGSFPNFDALKDGDTVSGDMSVGEYQGNKQYTLNPIKAPVKGNVGIAKAMEKKNENIKEAQERKNDAIKLAAIQRDAVLIVTNFYPEYNEVFKNQLPEKAQAIQERIAEWKRYLEQVYGDGQPF
jgi:hypothetical protein